MPSIMDDSTIELLYPKNGGTPCNIVSICYRSRDYPGGTFYPPPLLPNTYVTIELP